MKLSMALICALLSIMITSAYAVTFDEILVHKSSNSQPFWGDYYKNITWTKHAPYLPKEMEGEVIEPGEADYRGQIDIGLVDLDGDKKPETIKVIWGHGVSDHSLLLELYKDAGMKTLIAKLEPTGIQPNFKLEDLDGDGKLEVILWGAVSDPSMSQDVNDTSKPFEGHSSPHLYEVSIYKMEAGGYKLSQRYTSKKKYEPFCEEQPI